MRVDRVRVGEVLRLERVPVEPDPTAEYVSIGIRSFGKGIFHYEPKLGAQLGSLRFFEIQADRLVVSNIKGWEGAICVSSAVDAGHVASNRFLSYIPREDRIDVRWARWFFLSEPGIELIQRASPGSADRNRTLAIDRFEALEIPLPPIDEQRRVAAHLGSMADRSADLRMRCSRAKELSIALALSSVARLDLTATEKATIGWRTVTLADVLEPASDVTPVDSTERYDIAGVYSFGRGMFGRASLQGSQTSYHVLHRLHAGQLVMSRLKAWEGALAVVPAKLDGWFVSPEFPTFNIATAGVDREYLGALVTSEPFWTHLRGVSQGIGARRERVNASRLLEQVVTLPPLSAQQETAKRLRSIATSEVFRKTTLNYIQALVPAALNEAFAGLS